MTSMGAKLVSKVSNTIRSLGKSMDQLGANLEVAKYTERLVPSSRIVSVNGITPTISSPSSTFIAPSANIIGDVTIGPHSSVWYGATVRGDNGKKVVIGEHSMIGDRAVVHIAKIQGDLSTFIGTGVTVGQGAMIHAATLKDHCVIGVGAQVLDGAVVGSHSVVEAGSIVSPNTVIPEGEVWSGAPAKMVRKATKEDLEGITQLAQDMAELAALHAEECGKDFVQLAKDEEDYTDRMERSEDYFARDRKFSDEDVLGQGAPGRIFDTILSNPEEGLKAKQSASQKKK